MKIWMIGVLLLAGCFTPAGGMEKGNSENLFRLDEDCSLSEKLIVIDSKAVLFRNLGGESEKISVPVIFWRLVIEDCENEQNPVKEFEGKEFYRVGSSDGAELGWIETSMVAPYTSRFMMIPLPPDEKHAFRIFNRPYSREEFAVIPENVLEKNVQAIYTGTEAPPYPKGTDGSE